MEKKQFRTLEEIFKYAGGSMNLAIMLQIDQIAVVQWKHRGIPHKHWPPLVQKLGVSVDDLVKIDKKIRNQ